MPPARRPTRCFPVLVLAFLAALAPTMAWSQVAPPSDPAARPAVQDNRLSVTLAGEFALRAGKLEEAARWYLEAARAAEADAELAELAARVALLAKDEARATEALALWRARAETSRSMRNVALSLAMLRKDERTARAELDALLADRRTTGDDLEAWRYALIALEAGSGEPVLAGRLLEHAIRKGRLPEDLQPWLAFGDFAQRLGRDDLAERIVRHVVREFPGQPAATLLQASQLRRARKEAEARKVLEALELDARLVPELAVAVAREYAEMGDFARAATIISRGPQNERTWSLRAYYLAAGEDKAGMEALYRELQDGTSAADPLRRLLLGQLAETMERHGEALGWYESVPGGPLRQQARIRAAMALHALDRDAEAFQRLHDLQGDATVDDETRRDAYLVEAELHREDKQDAAELDAYSRALAAFPDDEAVLYSRALMWERRDDIPRAEADLRKILVADPDDVNALNALGYTLADRTTRYQEALELISRALAAAPDNAAIIDSYGWVLFRLGRPKDALVELRRAYTKQKDAEIASHVAEVLWVLGRRDEAIAMFIEARRLDRDSRSLARALEATGAVLPPEDEAKGARGADGDAAAATDEAAAATPAATGSAP